MSNPDLTPEVLPCPFCGSEASADGVTRYRGKPTSWWADGSPVETAFFCNCPKCDANNQGGVGGFQARIDAITAWNTRSTPAPTDNAALVEALKAELIQKCCTIETLSDRCRTYRAERDAALSSRAAGPTPAPVVEGAPKRIWAGSPSMCGNAFGDWDTEKGYDGDVEYIRADLTTPPEDVGAWRDVLAERKRQVAVEGWAPAHDDTHSEGEIAHAAACYTVAGAQGDGPDTPAPSAWPWSGDWWKPTTPRRNLVKAAALILAEVERQDRAALAKQKGGAT